MKFVFLILFSLSSFAKDSDWAPIDDVKLKPLNAAGELFFGPGILALIRPAQTKTPVVAVYGLKAATENLHSPDDWVRFVRDHGNPTAHLVPSVTAEFTSPRRGALLQVRWDNSVHENAESDYLVLIDGGKVLEFIRDGLPGEPTKVSDQTWTRALLTKIARGEHEAVMSKLRDIASQR